MNRSLELKTEEEDGTRTLRWMFVLFFGCIFLLTLIPWALFLAPDSVKLVKRPVDGDDCGQLLFQSPFRTFFPTSANETTSYYTLEGYGRTIAPPWSTDWNITESLHECVDRGNYSSLELFISCAKNPSQTRLCIIDKFPQATRCNNTQGYNSIYFFDDPSGTVYGGTFIEPTCSTFGVNVICGSYRRNYAALYNEFNNLVQVIRNRTICLQDQTVPRFVVDESHLLGMIGAAITLIALCVGGLLVIVGQWCPCCAKCKPDSCCRVLYPPGEIKGVKVVTVASENRGELRVGKPPGPTEVKGPCWPCSRINYTITET